MTGPQLANGASAYLWVSHGNYPLLATQSAIGERVASPGLEGGQVAVLRLHVASSCHVTSAAYSCERGGRITQMQYLLQLFANFRELRQREVPRRPLSRSRVDKGKRRAKDYPWPYDKTAHRRSKR